MKIYTKKGDDGSTSLINGSRIRKSSLRVEAYGTVDELNSLLGAAASLELPGELEGTILRLNNILFKLGSDLAAPYVPAPTFQVPRIDAAHIEWLEKMIDGYSERLPELKGFIIPGGTRAAASLHCARAVCRRAERISAALSEKEDIGPYVLIFLNRLSDFLFTAARMANFLSGVADRLWEKDF